MGPPGDAYGQLRNIFGSTAGFETLVSGNGVTLLHDGEQAFPAMLEAIEAAEREILLEMYWFGSDAVGRQFAKALSSRARAGLRVRVIYDAVGSVQSDGRMFARMRDAGCEVEQYNPIAPWRLGRIEPLPARPNERLLVLLGEIPPGEIDAADAGNSMDEVVDVSNGRQRGVRVVRPRRAQVRNDIVEGDTVACRHFTGLCEVRAAECRLVRPATTCRVAFSSCRHLWCHAGCSWATGQHRV